jgi:hypothetical protein
MEEKGGDDWLWKVLLYGNVLDYHFIKRLKSTFKTLEQYIHDNDLQYGVGLKRKDGSIQKNASSFIGKPFVNTDKKELKQFSISSQSNWKENFAAAIPNQLDDTGYPILFKGPLALIKEGLDSGYKGVAAYSDEDVVFTHSVRAIKGKEKDICLLKSIVSVFNSKLFAYYIFLTGTSTGIDFVRANLVEQIAFPVVSDPKLAELHDKIQMLQRQGDQLTFDATNDTTELRNELENLISDLYEINSLELNLIDYAEKISIPQTKANEAYKVFQPISNNPQILRDYISLFTNYFNKRLGSANKCLKPLAYIDQDLVAINFCIEPIELVSDDIVIEFREDALDPFKVLHNISIAEVTSQLYIQRDVKGFEANSFYIIKPNEYKCWHTAVASLDLAEFVDAILKSGAKQMYS